MPDNNAEITNRNLHAENAMLIAEIRENAASLTEILKDINSAKKDYNEILNAKEEAGKETEAFKEEVKQQKEQLAVFRNNVHAETLKEEEKKLELERDIKQLAKELAKYNEMILAAREEKEQFDNALAFHKELIGAVNALLIDKEKLEQVVSDLQYKKSQVFDDMTHEIEASEKILQKVKKDLSGVNLELDTKRKELESIVEKIQQFDTRYNQRMTDWAIMKARLEGPFKEMFPNIELKI